MSALRPWIAGFVAGALITAGAGVAFRQYRHRQAPAIVPADPRVDQVETYLGTHQAILEAEHRGPVGVLFLGDSITDLWRAAPWVWDEAFGKFNAVNAGIIFDQIQNVRWRIDHGELDGIKPRVIVLQIGSNNLAIGHDDPQTTAYGIADLIRKIRGLQPLARVLVLGVFPRKDPFNAEVLATNRLLATLIKGPNVAYLDPGAHIPPQDFPDGLHPNPDGYRVWAKVMLPELQRLYAPAATQPSTQPSSTGKTK